MKTLLLATLLFTLTLSATAQNIGVIPTPQKVETTEGECQWRQNIYIVDEETTPRELKQLQRKGFLIIYTETVDSIPGAINQQQAYQLEIQPDEIHIRYCTEQGSNYADLTLYQLQKHYKGQIPCMTITDWPALEYRGWMDDISRKPVTKREYAAEQTYILSQYKYNYGSYYTEHTSYNPQYPDLSSAEYQLPNLGQASPALMANLQCFGHFEETLKHPFYKEIRDAADVVNPSTEKTYQFLRSQIANTLRSYPWLPLFNINCDETETLGTGYARDYVDQKGADEVYCQHINRVYDIVQEEYAKVQKDTTLWFRPVADSIEVLMWGDIVAKNPAMLRKLPKEMNYVAWYYVAQPHYRDQIAPFKKLHEEQGTPFWVAPGISHSGCLAPVRNYMENIAYLTRDGYQAGARGMMNTAWDDYGEPLFGDAWHGMLWGAEMAWNPIKNSDPKLAAKELAERERQFNQNFDEQYSNILHNLNPQYSSDTHADYAAQIYAVTSLQHHPAVRDWYNYAALQQPLYEFFPDYVDEAALERCNTVDALVYDLLQQVDSTALPYYYYYLHRMQTVSMKSRLRIQIYRALYKDDKAALQKTRSLANTYFHQLHALECEYLRLWDEENIGYDRHEIVGRFDALGQEVLEIDRHIFMEVEPQEGQEKPLVTLRTLYRDNDIYYTLDGSEPNSSATRYDQSFPLERSATIKAISYNRYNEGVVSEQYLLSHLGMGAQITLNSQYATYKSIYSGGGTDALIDGQQGSNDTYADGHWQGYWGDSIDAVIDLRKEKAVKEISMRFMQNTFDWILAPKQIKVYTSADGKSWTLAKQQEYPMDPRETGMRLKSYNIDLSISNKKAKGKPETTKVRYIRVIVPNPGPLPNWHPAPNQPSYLFTDEIVIK